MIQNKIIHYINGDKDDKRPGNIIKFPDKKSFQIYLKFLKDYNIQLNRRKNGPIKRRGAK